MPSSLLVPAPAMRALLSALPLGNGPMTLPVVGYALRRRGWTVHVTDYGMQGCPDIRLRAVPPGGGVAVEVLTPAPQHWPAPAGCWQAVRIRSDRERAVWRLAARRLRVAALVGFVEDLGTRSEDELLPRYDCCG